MQPTNWIRGWFALCVWAMITGTFVLAVLVTAPIYLPLHRLLRKGKDPALAYVSVVYHTVVVTICYKWIAGMTFEHVDERFPDKYDGQHVMFVPGAHTPSLLMIPYYYLICKHLSKRLLVSTKEFDPDEGDYVTELFVRVLEWIRCRVAMPRGKKLSHGQLVEHMRTAIETQARHPRALTVSTDKSRAKKVAIVEERVKYSAILWEMYGIKDDLSWMTSTLFPRVRGFLATIEAMPIGGRVVFLFAGLNRPIWSISEPHKMINSHFRYFFVEAHLHMLKRRAGESHKEWEKRIMVYLIRHWIDFNERKAEWQAPPVEEELSA
ncbi:MAG TPA: hypothetical protein QF873_01330 [Patescibacteria group bacterium]|nr:hypothetical protein [Patescibacteria group bacterium]